MSHDCEDDSNNFDPLCDHIMTDAEGVALRGPGNPPKIPVRACPPRPEPRKFLTATSSYKVHLGTRNATHDNMAFNCVPTSELIVSILQLERDDMDTDFRKQTQPTEDEVKRHEREWKRFDNLIELIRLAGEIQLPGPGDNWNHQVFVAGVEIGHLNVQTRKAWTLA
jgi:hypothetical protein